MIDPITGEIYEGDQGLTNAMRQLKNYENDIKLFKKTLQEALEERYKKGDELTNKRLIKKVERIQYEYPYSVIQETFDEDQIAMIMKPSITKIKEVGDIEQVKAIEQSKIPTKRTFSYKII